MRPLRGIVFGCVALLATACGTPDDQLDPAADDVPQEPPSLQQPDQPPDQAALTSISATLEEWAVVLSSDSVPAGPVSIDIRNAGTMPHALEVEGNGEEWMTDPIEPGGSVGMALDLAAGEYTVYCPIDSGGMNHEQQGMVTRLRVY